MGKLARINAAKRSKAVAAGLPHVKATNADAVADAVASVVGPDGAPFACTLFALAGAELLRRTVGRTDFYAQAGTLLLQPNPAFPDLWFSMNASEPGHGYRVGEMHAWIGDESRRELIDFSSRHYTTLIAGTEHVGDIIPPGGDWSWRREEPPPYLWTTAKAWPDWVRLDGTREATAFLWAVVANKDAALIKEVVARAEMLLRGGVLLGLPATGKVRFLYGRS